MKSRAIVHSKFEARLLGASSQGSSVPAGIPPNLQASRTQRRRTSEQVGAQYGSTGRQQPTGLNRA
jgi:hypothetical protein